MTLTGLPPNLEGFGPLLGGVVQVPKDDLRALRQVFADCGSEVAAVIAEPVVGAAGVYPPAEGYLQELRRLCDAHGAFLILDEVVTGFGRLGAWWGARHYGVTPTSCTFAKAVTSGCQPLGGVLVGDTEKIAEVRGEGGVWAVGLAPGVSASAVRDEMLARGVIPRPIGDATIAFCPPLVIEDRELDHCVEALDGVLATV